MESDRGFKFKLLVPPRVNVGQINAVRPQEIVENSSEFLNTMQQGYNKKCDNEQNMPLLTTSVVAPSKPMRQDFNKMKVVSPLETEENICNPGKLYSKLFDEVDKIKYWKVKVDTDIVQKERKLQDNKRTIETQRKAIQELQFGNESLSIKLEEQISENEDLRNKNNATRNLCNILKETFQWSAEKMQLFESEREETHHLFMENSESMKKLIAAFDSLQIRVEADQQEMQRVKESLLEFADLKEKYLQEHVMKDEEIAKLQTKLKDKKDELQKVLLDLSETQKYCKQLQDSTNQQFELLKSFKTEKESLLQKLNSAEQRCEETQKKQEITAAALEQSKKEYNEIIQSKDLVMQELSRAENQQTEKLKKTETMLQELKNSLALVTQGAKHLEEKLITDSNELEKRTKLLGELTEQAAKKDELIKILEDDLDIKSTNIMSFKSKIDVLEARVKELVAELSRKTEEIEMFREFEKGLSKMKAVEANEMVSEEKTVKLQREIQKLEEENQYLRDEVNTIKTRVEGKCQETETVQEKIEEKCEYFEEEITKKEKRIKAVEAKLYNIRKKFESKFQAQEESKKENKLLKKQIAKETTKSSHLEMKIKKLQEESQNLKKLKDEDYQKLLEDLDSKSASAAELENEIQKLRSTSAEAVKSKEDAELKCQQKIADMVALMEKHKSQYDRMVKEKDAELNENKKKEMEAVALTKSLDLDLSKQRAENEQLRRQLQTETTEKETLQKELADLKREITTSAFTQSRNEQSSLSSYKLGKGFDTRETSSMKTKFDFSKVREASSCSHERSAVVPKKAISSSNLTTPCKNPRKTKYVFSEDIETPGSDTKKIGGMSKIKSYRIKTPPSTEKEGRWGRSTIELDPRSDSSDHLDIVKFSKTPEPTLSNPQCKLNILKKIQSPVILKSPGNSSKVAAIKRMRDAGWTAMTGCDKKKKTHEKIFA